MYRQPSLSRALEEWIIPYEELDIEEEIGSGHVGTVYRYIVSSLLPLYIDNCVL